MQGDYLKHSCIMQNGRFCFVKPSVLVFKFACFAFQNRLICFIVR